MSCLLAIYDSGHIKSTKCKQLVQKRKDLWSLAAKVSCPSAGNFLCTLELYPTYSDSIFIYFILRFKCIFYQSQFQKNPARYYVVTWLCYSNLKNCYRSYIMHNVTLCLCRLQDLASDVRMLSYFNRKFLLIWLRESHLTIYFFTLRILHCMP